MPDSEPLKTPLRWPLAIHWLDASMSLLLRAIRFRVPSLDPEYDPSALPASPSARDASLFTLSSLGYYDIS